LCRCTPAAVTRCAFSPNATTRGAPCTLIELTQPPQAAAPVSPTGAAVPSAEGVVTECVNPCKVVPFKPGTPAGKAAFADWREMELGSLARNMDLWGRHVLDDVLIVDSGGNGTISKAQRIANTLKQKQAGVHTNEVPPVLWARALDFGDAVLLLMLQQPHKGQPYYAARVYVNRDARYQMAASYHTSIASVPGFASPNSSPPSDYPIRIVIPSDQRKRGISHELSPVNKVIPSGCPTFRSLKRGLFLWCPHFPYDLSQNPQPCGYVAGGQFEPPHQPAHPFLRISCWPPLEIPAGI